MFTSMSHYYTLYNIVSFSAYAYLKQCTFSVQKYVKTDLWKRSEYIINNGIEEASYILCQRRILQRYVLHQFSIGALCLLSKSSPSLPCSCSVLLSLCLCALFPCSANDFGIDAMQQYRHEYTFRLIYCHATNWNNLQVKRSAGEMNGKNRTFNMISLSLCVCVTESMHIPRFCRKPSSSVNWCGIVKCLMQTHWRHLLTLCWEIQAGVFSLFLIFMLIHAVVLFPFDKNLQEFPGVFISSFLFHILLRFNALRCDAIPFQCLVSQDLSFSICLPLLFVQIIVTTSDSVAKKKPGIRSKNEDIMVPRRILSNKTLLSSIVLLYSAELKCNKKLCAYQFTHTHTHTLEQKMSIYSNSKLNVNILCQIQTAKFE